MKLRARHLHFNFLTHHNDRFRSNFIYSLSSSTVDPSDVVLIETRSSLLDHFVFVLFFVFAMDLHSTSSM